MFKINLFFVFFILIPLSIQAQFTLGGKVTDAATQQPLQGAHVVLQGHHRAAVSGALGEFSLKKIPAGSYTLKISYVGYELYLQSIQLDANLQVEVALKTAPGLQEEVVVTATRATRAIPAAFTDIPKREIEKLNTGRDLPYLLDQTPSVLVTSDAGAGVGYTSLRIRGTDISRINVMINGIPLNDPESQIVYWVDLPDFASSTDNIQVQRGVGTSVNGSGAFGASINLQTAQMPAEPEARVHVSGGSFNTLRNSVSFGTGRNQGRFALEGRLSRIVSDGYIDRADASLKSFYLSAGYFGNKSLLRLNVFSGKEITYQAWEGVPSELLETRRTFNPAGLYTTPLGDTLYYANQIDDYQQDHYQLFYSINPMPGLTLNLAGHYTRGAGYYESYKQRQKFSDYGLSPVIIGGDTLRRSDLVRRKHLDNDFAGGTFSAVYEPSEKWKVIAGGGYHYFKGRHFGRVIWARYASDGFIDQDYYRNTGAKNDLNTYVKAIWMPGKIMSFFGDLQFRRVDYHMAGTHDDLRLLDQNHGFSFFNPKAGLQFAFNQQQRLYASVAVANREPSRNDFRDADPGRAPKQERLTDYELGYEWKGKQMQMAANAYWMQYKDQLVLTGKINNVGSPVMVNIPDSYRAGLELQAGLQLMPRLKLNGHVTISRNRINGFTEYIDNWDTGGQDSLYYASADISFSPPVIAGITMVWNPTARLGFRLGSKYAGRQFIDNTSDADRSLDPWFTTDLRADYSLQIPYTRNVNFFFALNNLFNQRYESNAWVYSYVYEGSRRKIDGYFPQAGINFMAGLEILL